MRLILLIIVVLFACSDDKSSFMNKLPEKVKIGGVAKGEVDGISINCFIDFSSIEIKKENGNTYLDFSGYAGRSALQNDGSGVAFDALAAGSFRIDFSNKDEIILIDTFHVPNDPPDFWGELLFLEGELIDDQKWRGKWTCYPFYTRGDTIGNINGNWNLYEAD
ncbi:MAG TPA: hypothetical protein DF712_10920 [Balneola sp.]|jgi:hypothetical protein|nr:hypothetical protein [Bacteroidota bacterium]HCT52961.1 hypothetical protein [Balneola sp.]|tara:strand:+ start:1145 stop:1636 length:492 start_codon:yes stop_codon:yes gene_type:complete